MQRALRFALCVTVVGPLWFACDQTEFSSGRSTNALPEEDTHSDAGPRTVYVDRYTNTLTKNDTLVKLAATGHFKKRLSTDDIPSQPGMAYSMYTEARAFSRLARSSSQ